MRFVLKKIALTILLTTSIIDDILHSFRYPGTKQGYVDAFYLPLLRSRKYHIFRNNQLLSTHLYSNNIGNVDINVTVKASQCDDEAIMRVASQYKTRTKFHLKCARFYNEACKRGILDKVCQHMSKPRPDYSNDIDKLRRIASKCKTRHEFKLSNPAAYESARRQGLLGEICAHMPTPWTNKALTNEAKKYRSRYEFETTDPEAFQIARGRGILDKICAFMKEEWAIGSLTREALRYKSIQDFNNVIRIKMCRQQLIVTEDMIFTRPK